MASRKNTAGAKLKLSDEQIQQVIKFLMTDMNQMDSVIKMTNKEKIVAAAKWFNVHPQMIIDLTKGRGRFKNLLHTDIHKQLVSIFKKISVSSNKKVDTIKISKGNNKGKIKFSPEEISEMVEMLNIGCSIEDIAKSKNCSVLTIYRRVEKHPDYIETRKLRGSRKKTEKQEVPEVEVIPEPSEIIEHSVDNLINQGIQQVLKKILVNPEFYGTSINQVNSQFFSINEASQQEIDNIIIFRSYTILQSILSITPAELQAVYLTITLKEHV